MNNRQCAHISCMLLLAAALTFPQAAEAAVYYAATNGNDANPGSLAQPFRSITRGVSGLRPGDTLYIRGGTYGESFYSNIPGGNSWSAPVTIASYPGESAVIQPPASPDLYHVIHLGGTSEQYIIFDGLIVDGSGAKADIFKIWAGHIRIKNTELRNSPHYAILTIGTPGDPAFPYAGGYNEFINLNVHNNGSTDFDNAFYIQSAYNLIENCRFYSNAATLVAFTNQNASLPDNNTCRYNTFSNNGNPAFNAARIPAIITSEAKNSLIYSNLIYSNKGGGIYLYGSHRDDNNMVYNNTIYNNTGFAILIESGNLNAVIKNNILFQGPAGGSPIINGGTNVTFANNLNTDPLFVNATSGDLRLRQGSPAIDAGVTLSAVTRDFAGTSRPQGPAYDIGAYEYTGATPLPAPAPAPVPAPAPAPAPVPSPTPTAQSPYNGSAFAVSGTIASAGYDNGGEGVAYHDVDAANLMSSTYRPGLGVDSNGSGVGWIVAGEWLEYTVNVSAAGSYTLSIPVSHQGTGGSMHVSFNGVNVTGSLGLPNTGSWSIYQNITAPVNLSAGTQIMLVAFDTNGSTGYGPGLGDIVIAPTGGTTATGNGLTGQYFDNADFTGATFTRIDPTLNFDWGMGAPTNSMGVDYFSVRWTGKVQAQYSQAYTFYVTGDDGVRLWVNGQLLIDKWLVQAATEYAATINLNAGAKYDIKLEYYENYGSTAAQLRWSSAGTPKQIIPTSQLYASSVSTGGKKPYSGAPMAIPGTILVPRYDIGGEGVAYHDMEGANLMSSTWRPGEAVDTDNNRGIGWIQAGEWVEYTVNVSAAGTYTLSLPACHPGIGGTFHVNFDGVNKTGTITVPNTGSWEVNQTVSKSVSLSAGTQVMQVVFDTNGSTGYVCGIGDVTMTTLPTGTG